MILRKCPGGIFMSEDTGWRLAEMAHDRGGAWPRCRVAEAAYTKIVDLPHSLIYPDRLLGWFLSPFLYLDQPTHLVLFRLASPFLCLDHCTPQSIYFANTRVADQKGGGGGGERVNGGRSGPPFPKVSIKILKYKYLALLIYWGSVSTWAMQFWSSGCRPKGTDLHFRDVLKEGVTII